MKVVNRRALSKDAEVPPGYVYVGRGTPWGNPWRPGMNGRPLTGRRRRLGPMSRELVLDYYREYARQRNAQDQRWLAPLCDPSVVALVCWCAPQACHAQVLAELVEQRRAVVPAGHQAGAP